MISFDAIIERCAGEWGVKVSDIKSHTRRVNHVRARRLCFAVLREATGLSYESIGDLMGFDHGTVINACRAMERRQTKRAPRGMERVWRMESWIFCRVIADLAPMPEPAAAAV